MLFKARQDVTAKQIGEEFMIYDLDNKVIHVLNMTAAKIFQLCDGSHTLEEIAEAFSDSFDGVEPQKAYEDVKQTMAILEAKHLVVPLNTLG